MKGKYKYKYLRWTIYATLKTQKSTYNNNQENKINKKYE